jgi:hypothetical protein
MRATGVLAPRRSHLVEGGIDGLKLTPQSLTAGNLREQLRLPVGIRIAAVGHHWRGLSGGRSSWFHNASKSAMTTPLTQAWNPEGFLGTTLALSIQARW